MSKDGDGAEAAPFSSEQDLRLVVETRRWRGAEPQTEDALNSIAAEMKIGRSDLIARILREWLETNAYLPVRMIDEESETDGTARGASAITP